MNLKYTPTIPGVAPLSRRRFVTGIAAGGALLSLGIDPRRGLAATVMHAKPQTLQGNRFDLSIGYQEVNFTGRRRIATAVNGTIPAPVLRWREGDRVTLRVTNQLATDSSYRLNFGITFDFGSVFNNVVNTGFSPKVRGALF